MNAKTKACFTPHVMMHSLIGLGLGILVAHFIPSLNKTLVGLVLVALGVILDMMRKN